MINQQHTFRPVPSTITSYFSSMMAEKNTQDLVNRQTRWSAPFLCWESTRDWVGPTAGRARRRAGGVYRTALIFRGSKFSRFAALKEFVEKISRIRVAHVCDSAVAQILVE